METGPSRKEFFVLLSIIGTSVTVRVLTIWAFRPEFTGWFNHTSYYFVQVRGILDRGTIPYSDLPFLFYLYGLLAKVLTLFGISEHAAVVNSTRAVMVLAPAVTGAVVYWLVRSISREREMTFSRWLLVLTGAFLPLNLVHMPELLQKNSFGMLIFALLLVASAKILHRPSTFRAASIVLLALIAAFSHFGTLAVVLMFGVSVALAAIITEGFTRKSVIAAGSAVLSGVLSVLLLWLLAPERLVRVVSYAGSSFTSSLAGRVFFDAAASDKLLVLAGIILPLAAVALALLFIKRTSPKWPRSDAVFFLSNILLAYLLVFPLFDTLLLPRLLLFLPLPAIVIAATLLKAGNPKLIGRLLAAALVSASLLMNTGEIVSVAVTNASNRHAGDELERLHTSGVIRPGDLVITTYGLGPACNWFLGARSSLITSVRKDDFSRYQRIFVLATDSVPDEPAKSDADGNGELDDRERYEASRRNVVLPTDAKRVFRSENFEVFELSGVPGNWEFSAEGSWIGYSSK